MQRYAGNHEGNSQSSNANSRINVKNGPAEREIGQINELSSKGVVRTGYASPVYSMNSIGPALIDAKDAFNTRLDRRALMVMHIR